jgi:hypothetical protein
VNGLADLLERDGVFVCRRVLARDVVAGLVPCFADCCGRPGARDFALSDELAALLGPCGALGALATRAGGAAGMKPVRLLYFDKTPEANWAVPWHQDRTIAVSGRIAVDGYGPWTRKHGIDHVEPPLAILAGMLTLRLFLDDCHDADGPLEVARGSHRHGRIAAGAVAAIVARSTIFVGTGQAGDVLVMKALALHRSARAIRPTHRRVLHVDFSAAELPASLDWKLT